jgi:hypothetical protein
VIHANGNKISGIISEERVTIVFKPNAECLKITGSLFCEDLNIKGIKWKRVIFKKCTIATDVVIEDGNIEEVIMDKYTAQNFKGSVYCTIAGRQIIVKILDH